MRKFVLVVILIATLGCLAEARPDRNAFLNRKAESLFSLIRQVRADKEVRDRYMRHYAFTFPQLISYLHSLSPATLRKPGLYHVYSVPPDGHIKGRLATLKKGTKVYVDRYGNPQMVALCGNPLALGEKPQLENLVEDNLWSTETEELQSLNEFPDEEPIAEMGPPDILEPTADIQITEVPPTDTTGGETPAVFASTPGFPWAFTSFGGLPFLAGNGGGGNTPQVVPEPMTMVVGIGALALAFAKKRRKG